MTDARHGSTPTSLKRALKPGGAHHGSATHSSDVPHAASTNITDAGQGLSPSRPPTRACRLPAQCSDVGARYTPPRHAPTAPQHWRATRQQYSGRQCSEPTPRPSREALSGSRQHRTAEALFKVSLLDQGRPATRTAARWRPGPPPLLSTAPLTPAPTAQRATTTTADSPQPRTDPTQHQANSPASPTQRQPTGTARTQPPEHGRRATTPRRGHKPRSVAKPSGGTARHTRATPPGQPAALAHFPWLSIEHPRTHATARN